MSRSSLVAAFLLLATGCASAGPPASVPAPAPPPLGPGISHELARFRADHLSDVSYELALDVTGSDTVPGTVSIFVTRKSTPAPASIRDDYGNVIPVEAGDVPKPVLMNGRLIVPTGMGGLTEPPDLVLDYRGRVVRELRVNGEPVPDFTWSDGHISIPSRYLQSGDNEIDVRFVSSMAAAGASIIRFTEPAQGADSTATPDTYLYTLLVPADANQLFPCFDQPDLKATVRLQLVAPKGWTALANAPVVDSVDTQAGTFWRFAPTEPLSTYLIAFAAGPWHVWTDSTAEHGAIRLYARRSRADQVDADSLLVINRRALGWLEDYFQIDYPFKKFAFLLAPAFPFGGMEHPGAIFYNESRFIFREKPTLSQRLGRSNTIYHEVSHQWFGDLVTPKWFDDLWLKEGFATYMAAKVQASLNPGTGAWKTFYLQNEPIAYAVDATRGTTPLWQALPNLDLAKSNYGPIVYNKAPAVLKQLNYWVGEDAFRSGLQHLLKEHAYGNITWRDLLHALEESSGESLAAFGENYILRAGMPVVQTVLDADGGTVRRLALVQHPARELPGDSGSWWPGKVRVRLGYTSRPDTVLEVSFSGDTTVVAAATGLPAPDWVFPNAGDYGYGVFLLDDRSAAALEQRVGSLDDDLLRALTWGAFWDLMQDGRMAPQRFLELVLRELPRERDEQIASALLGRARTTLVRYLPDDAPGAASLRARFEAMLVQRMDDPALSYGLRKASLDALLATAHTPASLAVLRDLLAGRRTFDGAPLQEPSRWAAVETLLALGAPDADSLFQAERARDTSPEAARHAFVTGAAVPTAENKAEYFRRYFDDPDLNEEWVTASLGAFNRPEHTALTLQYLQPALEKLPWIQENRRIFFLPQWVNSFVLSQNGVAALQIVEIYLTHHPELSPDLRRKVLQAHDELERTVHIRQRAMNG